MLTNIESIMTKTMVRSYSWALFCLSFFSIGANIVNVIVFCLIDNASNDVIMTSSSGTTPVQTGQNVPLSATKIFCLTNGIWNGTLGLVLAFICNLIWYEKMALSGTVRTAPFAADAISENGENSVRTKEDSIFQLEALLFFKSLIFTIFGVFGLILSGYNILFETFNYRRTTPVEIFCYWTFCVQTLLTLALTLTNFSLTIYSFNFI